MAVEINTQRGLRRPLELRQLVEAVVAAGSADESSWIEWKSELDLTTSRGAFTVAKAILAFANRIPDQAAMTCQGLAYFVLGAESGEVRGTAVIDAADLENYLIKYLGSDGPTWSPTYVSVRGLNVLVFVVEAPQWGDPIHTLRESLGQKEGGTKGAIFVRRQAKSQPADPGDIEQLSKRLVRGHGRPKRITDLGLDLKVLATPGTLMTTASGDAIEEWLEQRRQQLLRLTKEDATRHLGLNRQWSDAEIRSFSRSVDSYLESCRPYVEGLMMATLVQQGYNALTVFVENPSDEHLTDVEVRVSLPRETFVADTVTVGHLPGLSGVLDMKKLHHVPAGEYVALLGHREPKHSKINPDRRALDTGSAVVLTESLGNLRPTSSKHTCGFQVLLDQGVTELEVDVSISSPSFPGVVRGACHFAPIPLPATVLADLVDPNPATPVRDRPRYPRSHQH